MSEETPDTGILIGYARVSTEDQNLDLQRDALIKAGVDPDRIYEEHVSGMKAKRPQLMEALKALRPGDTLIFWKLDRLSRSTKELIEITDKLEAKGIKFRSIQEPLINTSTAVGKLVFNVLAILAQFERDTTRERTIAGLKAAKARGRMGGRKSKLKPKDIKLALIMKASGKHSTPEIAARFGVSKPTLLRALARERDQEQMKEAA